MSHLFLNDVFWTLQGEGRLSGKRALFVRMPFCNLACSWCDTTFGTYDKWTPEQFVAYASSEAARFAVITGGEPLMHRHTPVVIDILKQHDFFIACETNGSFPHIAGIDYVTCSPKRDNEYAIHDQLWYDVAEFKYVVDEGFDWSVLDRHNVRPCLDRDGNGPALSLSPEYGRMAESIDEIQQYIRAHPWWRLSLQTHKMIGIP